VLLAIAFVLFGYAGGTHRGSGSQGMPELVLGLIMLVPGVILLAPFLLSAVARVAPHLPVAPRLALRDLARYRARSGSALAAISIGVMIAVIITILAQARYGDALDYAGPNLAPNQLVVASPLPNGPRGPNGPPQPSAAELRSMAHTADTIGTAVGGSHVVELDSVQVDVSHSGGGRLWSGPLYVATPQLLRAFGIAASQIDPRAELVTMRPGLSGLGGLSLTWCAGTLVPQKAFGSEPARHRGEGVFAATCSATRNVAHPVVQELSALPSGTSAPNTVVPEQTVARLGLRTNVSGWLIETPQALTATQLRAARQTASSAGLSVESKNDAPSSSEVIDWATVFGMALALCILAMSVGLLRSETAGDLRTLAATGAGNASRRMLTAATAVAMGLLGAALGTVCGYVGVIGYLRDNSQTGGIAALGNVPVTNLLLILLAMPALAAVAGWLLAGREPMAMAHQPIE
jgi:putative ABC transport system permease protein